MTLLSKTNPFFTPHMDILKYVCDELKFKKNTQPIALYWKIMPLVNTETNIN